jgi:hypothetical protein
MNDGHVRNEMKVGNILIKSVALLPKALHIESEPYVPGWWIVHDFDGYEMDRKIERTGWIFFCLAGEVKATVFGIDKQSMLRRAVGRLLAKGKQNGFNSLEITRIDSAGSERFPRARYVTVSAKWRHIQQSLFLGRGGDLPELKTKSASIG